MTRHIPQFLLAFAFTGSIAYADPITLSWTDNSDNELGFVMEGRLPGGEWKEVARTAANVTELEVDKDTHEAWRVKAFNEWGDSGYSNVLEKTLPATPTNLGPKKAPPYGRYTPIHTRNQRRQS